MARQLNIYPFEPGYKARDTAIEAARAMKHKAPSLRDRCYAWIAVCPSTADYVADRLGSTEFSVRPRISELVARGLVEDSGLRRENKSGRMAIVWRIV